ASTVTRQFRNDLDGDSFYAKIVVGPLDQGPAGSLPAQYVLLGKGQGLHTARPATKDRPSSAAFPGPIDEWRVVASSTRYRRTRLFPGNSVERKHEDVGCRTGLGRYPSRCRRPGRSRTPGWCATMCPQPCRLARVASLAREDCRATG